jgi:hypothetical protein
MTKEQKILKTIVAVLAIVVVISAFLWVTTHIIPILIVVALCVGAYALVNRKALSGGRKTLP